MDRPFHSGQEIEISISGTKVIGFGSWAQILVESGPRVRLRLAKNIRKILINWNSNIGNKSYWLWKLGPDSGWIWT